MAVERRCLVPGCDCKVYTPGLEAYSSVDDEDILTPEGEQEVAAKQHELQRQCAICGHTEMEHEIALTE